MASLMIEYYLKDGEITRKDMETFVLRHSLEHEYEKRKGQGVARRYTPINTYLINYYKWCEDQVRVGSVVKDQRGQCFTLKVKFTFFYEPNFRLEKTLKCMPRKPGKY